MEDNETDLASYTENITVLSKILKNDLTNRLYWDFWSIW